MKHRNYNKKQMLFEWRVLLQLRKQF